MVNRLVWYIHTGEIPNQALGYKDGDPRNTRFTNLKLLSHEERTQHYRDSYEEDTQLSLVPVKPVKRATFSNKDVNEAVEAFIKDKTLIDGRYV